MNLRIQTYLCLLSCLLLLGEVGCGSYQADGDSENSEENSGGPYGIEVTLQNEHLFTSLYPLKLYLLDTKGTLVGEESVENQNGWSDWLQDSGEYTLVLFSGLSSEEYLPPMALNARQFFYLSHGNHAETPLVIGKSIVRLTDDIKVSMSLSYAVSAIYLSLGGVPEEAESVEVRISPVSSGISLEGNPSNDGQFATIICQKEKGIWKAGPVYVFPSESLQTHLSVNVLTAVQKTTYGYNFNQALEAGRPYRFSCTGDGSLSFSGDAQVEGWTPEVSVEFPFESMKKEEEGENSEDNSEDNSETEDDSSTEDEDVLYATELPEPETVWGPFFVWKVEEFSASEVGVTLISPRQWLLKKDEAISVCEAYEEDGIKGWRPFTMEEAKEFRDQYDDTIITLSEMLRKNGLDGFNKYDCRYLCNDFNSTFCFYNNKILDSGTTVDYALRLVKEVRVKKK